MEQLKVLFHVSDNECWQRALMNIQNFLNDIGERGADVEVVANAGAVVAYYSDGGQLELTDQMARLSGIGVRFTACRNAVRAHSLDESLKPSFVEVVNAGITEIVKKQGEGYAYIKP